MGGGGEAEDSTSYWGRGDKQRIQLVIGRGGFEGCKTNYNVHVSKGRCETIWGYFGFSTRPIFYIPPLQRRQGYAILPFLSYFSRELLMTVT